MQLTDSNLAWMLRFGVTSMRFDSEGNVLEVAVNAPAAHIGWNNVTPEAPKPPVVPEPTDEDIRKRARQRRIQIAAESAADRAIAYAEATGLPLQDEAPE